MSYVDGFVLAVPSIDRERFRAMAAGITRVFAGHGAPGLAENRLDDILDHRRMIHRGFVPVVDEQGDKA